MGLTLYALVYTAVWRARFTSLPKGMGGMAETLLQLKSLQAATLWN